MVSVLYDSSNNTKFYETVIGRKQMQVFKLLRNEFNWIKNSIDKRVNGETPLFAAAKLGLSEILTMLINIGHADVKKFFFKLKKNPFLI